jgi:hypothetical protein
MMGESAQPLVRREPRKCLTPWRMMTMTAHMMMMSKSVQPLMMSESAQPLTIKEARKSSMLWRMMSAYDDDIAHGNQITEFGKTFKVDAVVKEFIFPNVKFAVKNSTLTFSNSEGSVCRQMAEKLKIADDKVEDWWDCQRDCVYNQLKGLRNNTIKGLKKLFTGKRSDVDDEMCCECLLVDHCLTPFLMQKDVFEKVHKIWLVWKTKKTPIS